MIELVITAVVIAAAVAAGAYVILRARRGEWWG